MPTQHTPSPIPRLNHTPRIRPLRPPRPIETQHATSSPTIHYRTRHAQPDGSSRTSPVSARTDSTAHTQTVPIRRVFPSLPPTATDKPGLFLVAANHHRRAYSPRICSSRQASTPPFRADSPPLYSAAPPNATTHVPSNQSDIPCPPVTSRIRQPLSLPPVPDDHPVTRRNSVYSRIQ
jgi:hypothetical protein